jgi:hypothetical protein
VHFGLATFRGHHGEESEEGEESGEEDSEEEGCQEEVTFFLGEIPNPAGGRAR